MRGKLHVLSVGVLFFMGQAAFAQQTKKELDQNIDEVVVVGFGRKVAVKELTGSVGTVSGAAIQESSAAASMDKALSGRVAGVVVGSASGQPGGAASIRVRGITSVNGNNNPIIIMDGVRISQGDLTGNSTTANILANLNTSDYESVTVLKDAVSTAVYGADAGAGVIIITTKAGKRGKPRVNVSSEQGVGFRAVKGPQAMNLKEWQGLLATTLANYPGYKVPYPNLTPDQASDLAKAGAFGNTYKNIFNSTQDSNWEDAVKRTGGGYFQNINASMSGGSDNITYYSSLGYFDQNSIIRNSFFNRITSSNKVDFKVSDKLRLVTDLQLSYGNMNSLPGSSYFSNPMMGYLFLRPSDPIYNSDGSYYYGTSGRLSNGLLNNAALLDLNYRNAKTARVFGNIQAEYKILKNLTYRFVFAPEYVNIEEYEYLSPLHGDGYATNGNMTGMTTRYFNFNVQNILSYNTSFGDKHNFSASLIQEAYKSDRRRLNVSKNVVGALNLNTLDSFVQLDAAGGNKVVSSRAGYALTLHYDYDRMVLVDLSGRKDGLSNFWPGQKHGNFWSAGLGFDASRLEAIQSLDFLSQLKLSVSYGQVGNILQPYQIPYALYSYNINYNNQAGAQIIGVDNPNLTWEKVKPLNVGLDLGFFDGRLTFGAAYYNKKTKDLIFNKPLSPSQGGSQYIDDIKTKENSMLVNVGDMVNRGFEFNVSGDIFKNPDGFSWRVGINASTLKNKMTKMMDNQDIIVGQRIIRVGEAVNSFYMPKWAGVDPENGNPRWYVNGKDNSEGVTSDYNKAQRAVQGTRIPTFFGGVDTSLSYQGISVDAQFSYGFGNKIYDRWGNYMMSDGQYTANYPGYANQLDYWTPENIHASNPKPMRGGNTGTGTAPANSPSSRYLYKGDYIRLRTLRVSYTFKKEMLRGSGLSNLQIYLAGNNIWTWRKDKNLQFDPDLQLDGIADFNLPPLKTYSLGVNLSF